MIPITQWLRRYTAYAGEAIKSTELIPYSEFVLPKNAALHYISDNLVDIGIRGSNMMIQNCESKIRVWHVEDGFGSAGKPRNRTFNAATAKKAFFDRQKRFSRIVDLERGMMKELEVIVFDYTFRLHNVIYPVNAQMFMNSSLNIIDGFFNTLNKYSDKREHLVLIKMPKSMPERAKFVLAAESASSSVLEVMTELGHWWIVELFKAINEGSRLSTLKNADKINLVFMDEVGCKIINLGYLRDTVGYDAANLTKIYTLLSELIETRTAPSAELASDVPLKPTEVRQEDGSVIDTVTGTVVTPAPSSSTANKGGTASTDEPVAAPSIVTEKERELPVTSVSESDIVPPGVKKMITDLAKAGRMSAAEESRIVRLYAEMEELPSPDGTQTLREFATVTDKDLAIDGELPGARDDGRLPKGATKSSIKAFKKKYAEEVLKKDIAACVMGLSKGGAIVTKYETERIVDALNDYTLLTVQIQMVNGKQTTMHIPIPTIDEDGVFETDGVRCTMDTQRKDAPIRKTKPAEAALTSYLGKLFITRSSLARFSYQRWITKHINAIGLDSKDRRIYDLKMGANGIPQGVTLPRSYTGIMPSITSFTCAGIEFYWNYNGREEMFGESAIKKYEKNGEVICGKAPQSIFTMDMHENIIEYSGSGRVVRGRLHSLITGLGKPPTDMASIRIGAGNLPMGLLLGYHMKLSALLDTLKVTTRTVPANQKYQALEEEIVLQFADVKLIISNANPTAEIIIGGFLAVKDNLRRFNLGDMDRQDVYGTLLAPFKGTTYALKTADVYVDLFLDPLTIGLLVKMKEPTELLPLYIRACELITNDDAPVETNTLFQRFCGNERVAGMVYKRMAKAVLAQRCKPNPSAHGLSIKPNDVWMAMTMDTATQQVQDANPIHNLKEMEAVTLGGEDGRSARTLVKRSRVYNPNDLGIISESTPDSSKVGIRSYFTPNAQMEDLRGMALPYVAGVTPSTAILSTTSLVMPGLCHDDGKRVVLAAIMQSAVVAASGYVCSPLRTGAELVIASRCSKRFAYTAEEDGEVTKRTDNVISITYASGKRSGARLGVVHGANAGKYIPHRMTSLLTKGDKFKVGDIIAYNSGFFEPDFRDRTMVALKSGAVAMVAFPEYGDVLEDGDAMDEEWGKRNLLTTTSKRKVVDVTYDKEIINLVNVGDHVDPDTPLLTIADSAVTTFADDAAIAALAKYAKKTPKAGTTGVISSISVIYMGNLDEATQSVKDLIAKDNARRKDLAKDLGRGAVTGEISRETFVGGTKVVKGGLVIDIYIDHDLPMSGGDKIVIGNQLKSICGKTYQGHNKTESGRNIDILFGASSPQDRIVNSCFIQGAAIGCMIEATRRFIDAYDNG